MILPTGKCVGKESNVTLKKEKFTHTYQSNFPMGQRKIKKNRKQQEDERCFCFKHRLSSESQRLAQLVMKLSRLFSNKAANSAEMAKQNWPVWFKNCCSEPSCHAKDSYE